MLSKRFNSKIRLAALIVVGAAAYANSFNGSFVFDDERGILENPHILHLWPISKAMSAPAQSTVAGRPIANLSLALNYALSGYNVWSYHLFNLLVHILAGLTLFGIIRRTLMCERLRERFGEHSAALAWTAAAIWLVHPLQTESVTYIVQRTESMMGLFYLLTLYSAMRAMEAGSGLLWPAVSIVCCCLGMGTKEVMVTAPVMILLYDRAFAAGSFGAALRRRWGLYAGLAGTWVILVALIWSGPRSASAGFSLSFGPLDYALNQCIVILHYLRLTFWLTGLCLDYNWVIVKDWGRILPPMLVILAMPAVTVWGLVRNRLWAYPAAWFFVVLSPTSSFVPIVDVIFEHRMYLPLAGLVVLVVLAGYVLFERWSAKRAGLILVAAVIIALGLLTLQRNKDYRSGVSIWQKVLEVAPDNARAHNSIGNALKLEGKHSEAINHYQQAIRLKPTDASAYNNLGGVLLAEGRLDEAAGYFQQALRLMPDYADAYTNLGLAAALRGRTDGAIGYFRQALQVKPDDGEAHYNLGIALLSQGKVDDAISQLRLSIQTKPSNTDAYYKLGAALKAQGKLDEAVVAFRQALQFRPDWILPLNDISLILATHPDPNIRDARQAIVFAERAARLTQYRNPAVLATLSVAYAAAGRIDDAISAAEAALPLTSAQGGEQLTNIIRSQLELYKKAKP